MAGYVAWDNKKAALQVRLYDNDSVSVTCT